MANEQFDRAAADRRWATLIGQWHEDRFGEEVQQFIGRWVPDDDYQLSDNVATVPPEEHAEAAIDAAKAKGQHVGPQFSAAEPYKARSGEASTTEDDFTHLLAEKAGYGVAMLFDKIGLESIARGVRKITHSDRIQNRRILARNLLSRWRDEGAAGALLIGSALRSNINGQVGDERVRTDSEKNFTTAGFSNPLHNFNVDGWDRDYKLRFYEAMGVGTSQGSGMSYKPSQVNIMNAARFSSNLGQVNPFDSSGNVLWRTGGHYRGAAGWEETTENMTQMIENWINKIFAPPPVQTGRLEQLQSELKNMQRTFMNNLGPGPRIPIPFRVATNLSDLLQQNILIPPELNRRNPATEWGATVNYNGDPGEELANQDSFTVEELTSDPTDRVFQQLYTNNQNPIAPTGMVYVDPANPQAGLKPSTTKRDPAGSIAGIPVADLQSPLLNKARGLYAPDDKNAVFSLKDDYKHNNLDNIQRGFGDNTPSNSLLQGLGTAVKNDYIEPFDANQFVKTDTMMRGQIFPFLFETVNKKGSKRSYEVENTFYKDANGNLLTDEDGNPILEKTATVAGAGGKEYKQFAFFQATLGSISESYNPTWSSKHFFGRTEQIHSYTMTDRTLEISFTITVDEIRKLQHLYERVLWLAQQTYASYDENGRMKAGPIIKMSIGDMFSNMTGFIRSLSYDWNYLGSTSPKWEITQGLRIPMACSVSLSFTVMHDVLPDRNHNFYPGPMIHEKGLYSERGATVFDPFAASDAGPSVAPLITEADVLATKQNKGGPSEVNMPNRRNQMFIDQAYNNAFDVQMGALEFV